jgi:quercetin dioxygenase-like cupin family protein
MNLVSALSASVVAMISMAAFAQEPQSFLPDPSGGFSRTIFETDVSPDFKITIRDFAFPPDGQPHPVSLPSSAFVHLLSGEGAISIAKKPLELAPGARSPVPAGAPIEVVNNGQSPMVIRALVIEAK